jgi:hypothetical protein
VPGRIREDDLVELLLPGHLPGGPKPWKVAANAIPKKVRFEHGCLVLLVSVLSGVALADKPETPVPLINRVRSNRHRSGRQAERKSGLELWTNQYLRAHRWNDTVRHDPAP